MFWQDRILGNVKMICKNYVLYFYLKNWLLLEILTNENLLGNFKLAWIYFEKLGTLVTFFDDIIDFHESSQNDIPQRIVKITSFLHKSVTR